MVLMVVYLNGLRPISQGVNNVYLFLDQYLNGFQSLQVFHRGLYWDPFCFYYTLTIYHFVPDLAKSHYSKKILSRQSCIELQSDIDSMYKWSELWQMDFNVIKCYIISFTRSKNPILFDYTMNGVPLQRVH